MASRHAMAIHPRTHLEYALGYLALGLIDEARAELALIPATEQGSPDALAVRIEVAMAAETWSQVVELAPLATEAAPATERPWIAWAYALRELQQIAAARDVLLRGERSIAEPSALVDYNLACYFCLLGDHAEARRRLDRASVGEPDWREHAATDPDLAALYPA